MLSDHASSWASHRDALTAADSGGAKRAAALFARLAKVVYAADIRSRSRRGQAAVTRVASCDRLLDDHPDRAPSGDGATRNDKDPTEVGSLSLQASAQQAPACFAPYCA